MRRHRTVETALLATLLAAAGSGARATQVATAAEATTAEPSAPEISLTEAVQRTLRNSFVLRDVAQSVEGRRAALLQASAPFDPTVFGNAGFSFRQQELLRAGLDTEIRRRVPLEFAGGIDGVFVGVLDRAADSLFGDAFPTAGSLLFDECTEFQTQVILDVPDTGAITLCLSANLDLLGVVLGENGEDLETLLLLLDIVNSMSVELEQDLLEAIADRLRETASLIRSFATAFRLQRERLGPLPEDEQLLDLDFELGLTKLFRSGFSLTSSLALFGTEDNYAGKPLDPALGDSELPNTFRTSASVRLVAPLGRGRGRVATEGPERAAAASLLAEQRLWVHAGSQEALKTVESYWSLAAAQERLQHRLDSATIQTRIFDLTRELVDADEQPRSALDRAAAQNAQAMSAAAAARQELVDARLGLLLSMGQTTTQLKNAPLAGDSLPQRSEIEIDPSVWMDLALELRNDLAAAAQTTDASRILAQTAKANLRREIDFLASVSFSGFHESFDQRLYDLSGYLDAVTGDSAIPTAPGETLPQVGVSGPSYSVGLRFNFPVKNRVAKGRLEQARATQARSEINERDLERTVRLRLHELVKSVAKKRQELDLRGRIVTDLEATLETSLERFRIGDLDLIDALTTEAQLTDARLSLVDVKRELALLSAQIRFQAGQLLSAPRSYQDFDPAELELVALEPTSLEPRAR